MSEEFEIVFAPMIYDVFGNEAPEEKIVSFRGKFAICTKDKTKLEEEIYAVIDKYRI